MENFETQTQTIVHADASLYDLSMLEEMDDNEYLVEVLTILLTETPVELKGMQEALLAGNAEMVCKKAHKIKGSAGIIQAGQFCALLNEIEKISKAGNPDGLMENLVENAAKQYSNIEQALKKHLKELS